MGLLDWLGLSSNPQARAALAASQSRQDDIVAALRSGQPPGGVRKRLEAARDGAAPWIATFSPAEMLIVRSHGMTPVASVSATCWMHYGWSWTEGHAQGWETALQRLRQEAKAAGANAVVDVKMRTVPLDVENSMDFSLVGTAVRLQGLPPAENPIVATVPALEFVKLLDADVVPTGIAIGAHYEWMNDWRGNAARQGLRNIEAKKLSELWEFVRRNAHSQLRLSAAPQGNGVLAHVNFSQMFEQEGDERQPKRYLARHIVIATTVDARRGAPIPHDVKMVVDMRDDGTPLIGALPQHQSYAANDSEGAI